MTLAKCRSHVVIYVVFRVQTLSESTMLGFRCPLLSVGRMLIRAIHGASGRNVNHQDSQVIEEGLLKDRRFLAPGKVRSLKQTVHWLDLYDYGSIESKCIVLLQTWISMACSKIQLYLGPLTLIKMEVSLPSHAQQVPTLPESEKACSTVWRHQSSSSTLTWSVHSHTWHSTLCM